MANAPDMTSGHADSGGVEEGSRLAIWGRIAAGTVVSFALVGGVIWMADPSHLWAVWSRVDVGWLAVAVALYGGVLVGRSLRLAGLVRDERTAGGFVKLLWASAGHSFATQLLPARSGEFVFPELWRRATDESYTGGLVFLTAIRAVELGVVAVLFAFGLASWLAAGEGAASWWPSIVGGSGLALFAILPLAVGWGIDFVEWLLRETWLSGVEILDGARELLPQAQEAVDRLEYSQWAWILGTTLVVWVLLFGVYFTALAACGLELGIAQTVVGSAGGVLGNLLPIGAIGSLGTMEAGWTAAFRATGAPVGPVAAAGFLVHAIVVVGTGLTTLATWASLRLYK